MTEWDERRQWGRRIDEIDPSVGKVMMNRNYAEADMKLERIKWKGTKGRQQLLLGQVYDAVTEEFTRDAMASLATVLAHICIVTDVAKLEAIEAFGNAYDEARNMVSGSGDNASLLN
jgi:hypothetical protein